MNSNLEEQFKNLHLLSREERIDLLKKLELEKPKFLEPYVPRWWWWRRCVVKVLLVCDSGLNFGVGGFDLSEFLTTFNELESQSFVNYEVTLAHRQTITNSPNPVVVDHISNFRFDTSVNLDDFDQVWLFAIDPNTPGIPAAEVNAIEAYMDGGGGLFATGDHGALGKTMCGEIPRVKKMRYWDDFPPGSSGDVNEVSMAGKRRNDTNQPRPGNSSANTFDHQSDNIPQTIAVRTFAGGFPHPLLSISPVLRPSGIIDIMPDHPHEGECAPETSFTVNGITVPTQIIATSFVPGGNTTEGLGGKVATVPHCFPSIAVWDGRLANVGRIVVDSTWHHFVNINLNGADSGGQSGLDTADFIVIRQYYMNIARWMSRRKFMICWRPWILFDLFRNSQLVESSLNNPVQDKEKISLADLGSIGALAEEILASKFNPSFARDFLVDVMSGYSKSFSATLDPWKPEDSKENGDEYYQSWIQSDLILHTAIGGGFISMRDDESISSDNPDEKSLARIDEVFLEGMGFGFRRSVENLEATFVNFKGLLDEN